MRDFNFFDSLKILEEDILDDLNDENSEIPKEQNNFSTEKIEKNINIYTSKKLCQIIVSYRYLGLNKDLAIICMKELGKRRDSGDPIDFENEIELMLEELPKLDFKPIDIGSFIFNKVKK